jgi:hypothetical protein
LLSAIAAAAADGSALNGQRQQTPAEPLSEARSTEQLRHLKMASATIGIDRLFGIHRSSIHIYISKKKILLEAAAAAALLQAAGQTKNS